MKYVLFALLAIFAVIVLLVCVAVIKVVFCTTYLNKSPVWKTRSIDFLRSLAYYRIVFGVYNQYARLDLFGICAFKQRVLYRKCLMHPTVSG